MCNKAKETTQLLPPKSKQTPRPPRPFPPKKQAQSQQLKKKHYNYVIKLYKITIKSKHQKKNMIVVLVLCFINSEHPQLNKYTI